MSPARGPLGHLFYFPTPEPKTQSMITKIGPLNTWTKLEIVWAAQSALKNWRVQARSPDARLILSEVAGCPESSARPHDLLGTIARSQKGVDCDVHRMFPEIQEEEMRRFYEAETSLDVGLVRSFLQSLEDAVRRRDPEGDPANMPRRKACPRCGGDGYTQGGLGPTDCIRCDGTGSVKMDNAVSASPRTTDEIRDRAVREACEERSTEERLARLEELEEFVEHVARGVNELSRRIGGSHGGGGKDARARPRMVFHQGDDVLWSAPADRVLIDGRDILDEGAKRFPGEALRVRVADLLPGETEFDKCITAKQMLEGRAPDDSSADWAFVVDSDGGEHLIPEGIMRRLEVSVEW